MSVYLTRSQLEIKEALTVHPFGLTTSALTEATCVKDADVLKVQIRRMRLKGLKIKSTRSENPRGPRKGVENRYWLER